MRSRPACRALAMAGYPRPRPCGSCSQRFVAAAHGAMTIGRRRRLLSRSRASADRHPMLTIVRPLIDRLSKGSRCKAMPAALTWFVRRFWRPRAAIADAIGIHLPWRFLRRRRYAWPHNSGAPHICWNLLSFVICCVFLPVRRAEDASGIEAGTFWGTVSHNHSSGDGSEVCRDCRILLISSARSHRKAVL